MQTLSVMRRTNTNASASLQYRSKSPGSPPLRRLCVVSDDESVQVKKCGDSAGPHSEGGLPFTTRKPIGVGFLVVLWCHHSVKTFYTFNFVPNALVSDVLLQFSACYAKNSVVFFYISHFADTANKGLFRDGSALQLNKLGQCWNNCGGRGTALASCRCGWSPGQTITAAAARRIDEV